jgi:UDP-2-acetamido-3-amino-2,3-dideoxy-glucuronate N-acetyltransferase
LQTGWISAYGHKLQFNNNGEAVCIESGQKYLLSEGQINRVA